MKKYIFFDFNGTIIDDVDLCLEILNDLLKKQNKPLVTRQRYKEIFTFPVKKYYELAGIDFSLNSFEELAVEFIDAYQPRSLSCGLYPNAKQVFQALKDKGYHLVILSASEKKNLLEQCDAYEITSYFDAILGIDNIHAESKVQIALNYMKDQAIQGKDVLFIGDTLHDLEVAYAMEAECTLVSCGHQSKEVLASGGVPILSSISDVLGYLSEE